MSTGRRQLVPPLRTVLATKQLKDARNEREAIRQQLVQTVEALERTRRAKAPRVPKHQARRRLKGDRVRICAGDLHGMKREPKAVAAFLHDVAQLNPHEIILGGDIVDCGGFLAQHHTLGYVAETDYSYEEDTIAGNQFLDSLQRIAAKARFEYLEGNHERRVETWAVTQVLRHARDAELLRRAVAPEFLLDLKARDIPYRRLSVCYDGLDVPGVIKRDACYYFHGITTSKHAAALTLLRTSANCVFFHTHRAQSDIQRRVSAGTIGAWNPGCLCAQQPLWQHGAPTDWTNGYAVQFVTRTGKFLHINVPILDGTTLLSSLLGR